MIPQQKERYVYSYLITHKIQKISKNLVFLMQIPPHFKQFYNFLSYDYLHVQNHLSTNETLSLY